MGLGVAGAGFNSSKAKDRFATLMRDQAPACLMFCQGSIDDKAIELAIDAFTDKAKRERFYKFFKEIETLYEIISPDPFLREHIDNYAKLSALYKIVRNAFIKRVALYKELAKKTEGLIRERAEAYGLKEVLPLVKIDDKTVEALKKTDSSNAAKIINLGKSLIHAVYTEGERQPYLLPIGERAEAILERYDDRQISTQEALAYLEKLLAEYLQAKKEHEQSGFDLNTFTIYWVLKQSGAPEPEKIAPLLNSAFVRFANYKHNAVELRQLKAELYKVLLPVVGKGRMVELVERLLKLQRKWELRGGRLLNRLKR